MPYSRFGIDLGFSYNCDRVRSYDRLHIFHSYKFGQFYNIGYMYKNVLNSTKSYACDVK